MWIALEQLPSSVCKAAIWDRISGWEVVVAVSLIMIGWTAIQISRMYFMWKVAAIHKDGSATE